MRKCYLIRILPSSRLPLAQAADDVMEHEDFREYVALNGYHFNDKLAEWAIGEMENVDKTKHKWSVKQVTDAYKAAGYTKPEGMTDGDIAYLANMAYADFIPDVLKTETDCIRYANAVTKDPDGYDEMPFMRWLADKIGREETISWDKML